MCSLFLVVRLLITTAIRFTKKKNISACFWEPLITPVSYGVERAQCSNQ